MAVATPAIPASGVAVVNTTGQYVSVNIAGGTMTNVSVNGATVGTGAGNYALPPGGSLVMTYTIAPTSMTWTAPPATSYTPGYSSNNPGAEGPGYNPFTSMPYAQHPVASFVNLGTGVSN